MHWSCIFSSLEAAHETKYVFTNTLTNTVPMVVLEVILLTLDSVSTAVQILSRATTPPHCPGPPRVHPSNGISRAALVTASAPSFSTPSQNEKLPSAPNQPKPPNPRHSWRTHIASLTTPSDSTRCGRRAPQFAIGSRDPSAIPRFGAELGGGISSGVASRKRGSPEASGTFDGLLLRISLGVA